MAIILHIETTTKNCAVALSKNDELITATKKYTDRYIHGEKLHLFIRETLEKANKKINEIDAVAVSKGPGSYTGLRIGVATAKGICYALSKPLIALDTLSVLARSIKVSEGYIIPMIDARRDEVYTALFSSKYEMLQPTAAKILNETQELFTDFLDLRKPLYFVGDGAQKARMFFKRGHPIFKTSLYPCATQMIPIAFEKYKNSDFEELSYFEPYYLKNFVVTLSKSQK